MFHNLLVSAPSRGDTGGSNELSVRFKMDVRGVFPSPPEVTGGSYPYDDKAEITLVKFPSPRKLNVRNLKLIYG